jgi:hypothetical protein
MCGDLKYENGQEIDGLDIYKSNKILTNIPEGNASPYAAPTRGDTPLDPQGGIRGTILSEVRTQNQIDSEARTINLPGGSSEEFRGPKEPEGGGILNLTIPKEAQKDILNKDSLNLTRLSAAGHPDYNNSFKIKHNTDCTKLDFKNSYTALSVNFNLPDSIKFPPIPVTLDETNTVYPLSGISTITGLEYLSANNILTQHLNILAKGDKKLLNTLKKEFFIKVSAGFYIPFKNEGYKPFYNVINELQENRRLHKKLSGKGSAMERIYKDLGNMLYGKTVTGLSNKQKFDARTETMKALKGGFLTNPMIASWITGFVRSLLAELLNQVVLLGGKVTAVTTDGFVCDIENLELKVLEKLQPDSFLQDYRDSRTNLSGDPESLEIKTDVDGIIQ